MDRTRKTTEQEFEDFIKLLRRFYMEASYPDFIGIGLRACLTHRLTAIDAPLEKFNEAGLTAAIETVAARLTREAGQLRRDYRHYHALAQP